MSPRGKAVQVEAEVSIVKLTRERIDVYVRGASPLIMNRMSEKAKRELLLPPKKKNAAERAVTLKHEPLKEYQASVYRLRDEEAPTLLCVPAVMFKGALKNAALDIPGAAKAQIGRLTYVEGDYVPIFGVPQIYSAVVRNSDINRTPDIRTRAIVPEWACMFSVVFQTPILNREMIANLLAAAGEIVGIGDYRPQKGAGAYGRFELVQKADINEIVKFGGREAQLAALDNPEAYDSDTEEMIEWFGEEVKKRGLKDRITPTPEGNGLGEAPTANA